MFLLGMIISTTFEQECQESVLFYPVLNAYSTHYSWIITAHVSLGDLDKQWKMFIQYKARSQQLLNYLHQKPLDPNGLLSALQTELANLDNIYTSYKLLILPATQLLRKEHSINSMSPFNKREASYLSWGLPIVGSLEQPQPETSKEESTSSSKHKTINRKHWQMSS